MVLIKHQNSNDGNNPGLSGVLMTGWRHELMQCGVEPGTFVFENMENLDALTGSGVNNGWYVLLDGTAAFDIIDEVGGVREFDMAADNEDAMIVSGGGVAGFCIIDTTASDREDIILETRVKLIDVSGTELFFGLVDPAQTSPISATDDTMDTARDYIGFQWKPTANTMNVELRETGNSSDSTALASTYNLTDDTWVKLAIRLFTKGSNTGKLVFYIDNEVVKTIDDFTDATNGVPDAIALDTELACCLVVKAQGAAEEAEVDHIAYGYQGSNA